ncbi:response regulator, partial [Chamaesiphon sp. VAR_69_metabat_338]|uniref:response regulator n=1 Tax=Chamaesiphon sp. VAR_69_metabat_338 TaxID=2964704 RepID=UPI00286E2A72
MLQDRRLTAPVSSSPPLLVDRLATAPLDREYPAQPVRGGTILAIDNNPDDCDLLARQLKQQGYVVATATNAAQALRLLNAIPFDLIAIDVLMPGSDGLDLLQQLKQNRKLKYIPAIAISTPETIDVALRCIELGAEDYLHKP